MSDPLESEIDDLVDLAHRLADAASEQTLARFRAHDLTTQNKLKGSGFDPVTEADRASEAAMRAILSDVRPNDGIFGEEEERTKGTSGLTWVLDPIDGTRAFISGMPIWATLIALDDGERGRIGIIEQPYLHERFTGVLGERTEAYLDGRTGRTPISTSGTEGLADATFFTTDPFLFDDDEWTAFIGVKDRACLTRYGTDCYAYGLLAMGQVDLVVESGLQPYDIASHVPLITAAGGVVTAWDGGDCRWGGQVVAAATEALHAEALEILAPHARDQLVPAM
ncbi:MAG: histidinol-phosphatase [Pseudomonadota bacterium]